jgi:hypothetical protein
MCGLATSLPFDNCNLCTRQSPIGSAEYNDYLFECPVQSAHSKFLSLFFFDEALKI